MRLLPMTVISPTWVVVPPDSRHASEHARDLATLRFSEGYANVKRSGIANTNERLGADPANRVTHRLRARVAFSAKEQL